MNANNSFLQKEQELETRIKQLIIDFANDNLKTSEWPFWEIGIDEETESIYINGERVWEKK